MLAARSKSPGAANRDLPGKRNCPVFGKPRSTSEGKLNLPIGLADGLPYLLLWSALGASMLPSVRSGWPLLAGSSIIAALVAGIVEWTGLVVIAVFASACLAAMRTVPSTPVRVLAWGTLVFCALALAAHRVPGINNVLIYDDVAVSPSAELYTLYWNYDKALVGVFLFALLVQPQRKTEWNRAIARTAVIAVLTPTLVVVPALMMGFVAWDPKWPSILVLWLPANLLVTCLAEESLFRGLLQRNLANALGTKIPSAGLFALFTAAAAFGVAHLGGGLAYVFLATLAGIGYGLAYHVTQRVEASILVHFTVNLVHLSLFTYPFVASN